MPKIITSVILTPKGLIEFRFEPLHFNGSTIYAVYCAYAGTQHCFHLSENTDTTEFQIMDRENCPYDFHNLEQLLSSAIYEFNAS